MRIRCLVGGAVALLCAPAAAQTAGIEPDRPPALCAGQAFADQIGTRARERMTAGSRPERLWGLGGDDVLLGSTTRATCLFGGEDRDVLTLRGGGGAAYGETGADALTGGPLDDLLSGGAGDDTLTGGAGDDVVDGGIGRDALDAGAGADAVDAMDGKGEVVDCGDGHDIVAADRYDALIGCETPSLAGPAARRAAPALQRAGLADIVRLSFRAPETARAGAYRVILLDGPCLAAKTELARVGTTVNRGRRIRLGLRPPASGWCAGVHRAAVVRAPACPKGRRCLAPPPLQPFLKLSFDAR